MKHLALYHPSKLIGPPRVPLQETVSRKRCARRNSAPRISLGARQDATAMDARPCASQRDTSRKSRCALALHPSFVTQAMTPPERFSGLGEGETDATQGAPGGD